jgi:hypothetical protein
MDNQDWTPVVIRRRYTKTEAIQKGMTSTQARDTEKSEKIRLAKLASNDDVAPPKKRVNSESIQALIRKRIDMKLSQDKADMLCSFPKHTFRDIESQRLIPNNEHMRKIQSHFGIQVKIDTIVSS